jgi:hypothetical protein
MSNITADAVVITDLSISGGNNTAFAFYGQTCGGTISPGQTCPMIMSCTPNTIGSFTSNLDVSVTGYSQQIVVPLDGTGGAPLPTLTSISPSTAYVNGSGFTLTATGTGFVSGSVVYWNNSPLTTNFVSSTTLTAPVPASDLTTTNTDWVQVCNPNNGGCTTTLYFTVVTLDPYVSSISPSAVLAGSTPSAIVVQGSEFMTGATILWNGKPMSTTYISSSELQATPTTAQLAAASIVQLSVSNPPPGGISSALDFDVTYPAKITILDLPANNLVWDPYAQLIYASMPSSYGTNGNTIAVIKPTTGKVTGYHFAGSEPNQLALSSDSKYLYVGLNGNGSVQRLILPTFVADIDVSLGSSIYGGLNTALSLQVDPSDDHTWAVAEGTSGCCGSSGLYFFKDTTLLPDSITYPTITQAIFVNSNTLYGYYSNSVSDVTVNSNGGTLGTQWTDLAEGNTIAYDAGLIYGSAGEVLNPSTGLLVGSYDVSGSCCGSAAQLLPDSAINRVFALGTTPFFNQFGVTSYNLSKFTPVAVANLSQLTGNTTPTFIRWGNSGLAFVLAPSCCGNGSNQVVLVQSPSMLLTTSATKNPKPVAQSLAPASATHGSGNFLLTIQGTNFVPGSQVTWNGTSLYAEYVSPTQLNLYVSASVITNAGTGKIVVTNPAPGGGASTALTFTIN